MQYACGVLHNLTDLIMLFNCSEQPDSAELNRLSLVTILINDGESAHNGVAGIKIARFMAHTTL